MASPRVLSSLILVAFLSSPPCLAFPDSDFGWGLVPGGGYSGLFPDFYQFSCPQANDIVMSVLFNAISKDPRMAASLLRLHFHDCFVQVPHYSSQSTTIFFTSPLLLYIIYGFFGRSFYFFSYYTFGLNEIIQK